MIKLKDIPFIVGSIIATIGMMIGVVNVLIDIFRHSIAFGLVGTGISIIVISLTLKLLWHIAIGKYE